MIWQEVKEMKVKDLLVKLNGTQDFKVVKGSEDGELVYCGWVDNLTYFKALEFIDKQVIAIACYGSYLYVVIPE